jgi:predicted hydrolase (HD superfamily)
MEVTRDEAWRLFCEWTASESLRKHVLGVEAAMVGYARDRGEDEELWAATGILHDLDYEKYPDLETGHPRYAVDELSGFIAACALVRPTGIHGMTPKSVKKKLKTPAFAAGVNRDEVRLGAEELGVDFDEHIAKVIASMEERATELGLDKGAGA